VNSQIEPGTHEATEEILRLVGDDEYYSFEVVTKIHCKFGQTSNGFGKGDVEIAVGYHETEDDELSDETFELLWSDIQDTRLWTREIEQMSIEQGNDALQDYVGTWLQEHKGAK
jgi:hypothetical protein